MIVRIVGQAEARRIEGDGAETGLSQRPEVEEHPHLHPMDDPLAAAALADAAAEPLVVVGHLPHLSRVASLLLAGDSDGELLTLPTGAVAALEREDDLWRVRWMLTPKLARALAGKRGKG